MNGDSEVRMDNLSLVNLGVLSTPEFSASRVKVYPNPANDFINIESNDTEISEVALYDILGKQLLSQNELANNRLDISNLTKGVYFMKISANGNSITKKIIKK
jgi:hypothetical protein